MTREIASLGECRFRISNIHQNSMGKVDISTVCLKTSIINLSKQI